MRLCERTGHPCGTDTYAIGHECACSQCVAAALEEFRVVLVLWFVALVLSGCTFLRNLPDIAPPHPCRECLKLPTTEEKNLCLLACTAPRPTPTHGTTPMVEVPATPTATVTPTVGPSPTPTWTVTIKLVNGFGHCNPRATKEEALASPRNRCDGDRTYLYVMPGFDIIPKGTGCAELWGANPDPSLFNRCMNNDSPGTPCNGAAACDHDHLGCPRTNYGCNGRELGDPRGSILNVTGGVTCVEHDNHYGMTCRGEPGAHYMICARPFPDAHDEQGNPLPVKGTGENCKAGFF